MSGIYSRTKYDKCNNIDTTNITVKPGILRTTTIQKHPNECMASNGPRNTRLLNSSEINADYNKAVDIESSLYGLDIPLSRCIDSNTLQEKNTNLKKLYNNLEKKPQNYCSKSSDFNYTRLNPHLYVSELPYNNYGYPIIDPREFVFYGHPEYGTVGNDRIGFATQYKSKISLEKMNKEMREIANKFDNLDGMNS